MYPKITLMGYLSRDPQSRAAGQSTVYTNSLAANCGYGDRQTTQWYTLQQWGDDCDLNRTKRDSNEHLFRKSSRVLVTGFIKSTNAYVSKVDGTPKCDIVVEVLSIEYVPSGGGAKEGNGSAQPAGQSDDYSALPV